MALQIDSSAGSVKPVVDQARYTEGALRLFFRAMEAWGASVEQMQAILGVRAERTLHLWRKAPPEAIGPDNMRRIGAVLGI